MGGALYLGDREEEGSFDAIIRSNEESVFGNDLPVEKRIMWTGCYNERSRTSWVTRCRQDPSKGYYNNFCEKKSWVKELKDSKLQLKLVKDYGKNNGCWKLYLEKQIKSIQGYNSEKINEKTPRLPFACIAADKSSTTGKDAFMEILKLEWCKKII